MKTATMEMNPDFKMGPQATIMRETGKMEYRGLEFTEEEINFLHECYKSYRKER